MPPSIQILKKVAGIIEVTPGTYLAPNVLLPFTSFTPKFEYAMIEDESIVGIAFPDLPVQGVHKVAGSLAAQVDIDSIEVLLEAALGSVSSQVYSCPTTKNVKSMSFVMLDEVKTNKYAGVYLNSFMLESEAEGDLKVAADIIGWKAEVRDDTAFPAMSTEPGTRLVHHHACGSGTGYMRIGDQTDALAAGDNFTPESIAAGINWQFDHQYGNCQEPLIPLSGAAGRPEAVFNFTVPRHEADTLLGFRDNHTSLQAELLYYASASANLKIQIPNLVIESLEKSDDDVTKLNIACKVARNGIGSNYSNTNMSFNTPIQITVDNT